MADARATRPAAGWCGPATGWRSRGDRRAGDWRSDAETLGSLYLAGVGIETLHRAGRITGTAEAARRFAAMADLPDEPFNFVGF